MQISTTEQIDQFLFDFTPDTTTTKPCKPICYYYINY